MGFTVPKLPPASAIWDPDGSFCGGSPSRFGPDMCSVIGKWDASGKEEAPRVLLCELSEGRGPQLSCWLSPVSLEVGTIN